jgi:hypothetical protein
MTDAIHTAYDVYKAQDDVDVGTGVLAYVRSDTSTVAILIPNYSPELVQAAHDVLRAFPAVSLQYNVRRLVDVDDGAFCYFEITTPWYTNSWPLAHGEYWHVACTTSPTTHRYHVTTWTDAIYILTQLRIRDPLAFPLPTSHANSGIVSSDDGVLPFHYEMHDDFGDGE